MNTISKLAAAAVLSLTTVFTSIANAQETSNRLEINRVKNAEKLAVCITDKIDNYLKTLPAPKSQTLKQLESQFRTVNDINEKTFIGCASRAAGLTAETVSKLKALKNSQNSAGFEKLMKRYFDKPKFAFEMYRHGGPQVRPLLSEMRNRRMNGTERAPSPLLD